jgi:hypothetical protein
MQSSHANAPGERGHPRGFPGFRPTAEKSEPQIGFSRLSSSAARRFSYFASISSQAKTSNAILQLVPEAIGKAKSSSNACVSWETINCPSMECTLQPVTSETAEMAHVWRLKWPRQADRGVQIRIARCRTSEVGRVCEEHLPHARRLTFPHDAGPRERFLLSA